MFKIAKERVFTVSESLPSGETYSVTFNFDNMELMDYGAIKKVPSSKEEGNINTLLIHLRSSITKIEGFSDEQGNPLKLYKEDGQLDESVQRGIFLFLRTRDKIYGQILTAYTGEGDLKN